MSDNENDVAFNLSNEESVLRMADLPEDNISPTLILPPEINTRKGDRSVQNKALRQKIAASKEIIDKYLRKSQTTSNRRDVIREIDACSNSMNPVMREPVVRVVATPVPFERPVDRSEDKYAKKSIFLQKLLILLLCFIISSISVGAYVYLKEKDSDTAENPLSPSEKNHTPSYTPSNILSNTPSNTPSNIPSNTPFNILPNESPIVIGNWAFSRMGNIEIGPGSYYTDNQNITIQKSFNNEEEAFKYVLSFNYESPENPIIMWMILHNQLLGHRLLFLSQNLDDNPSTAEGFIRATSDFVAITNSPSTNVYYQRINPWRIKENGDIGIGEGSLYFKDPSISIVVKSVRTEKDGHEYTEIFNVMNPDNPIIMWEISWMFGYYRAHRLEFFSQDGIKKDHASTESFVKATVDFIEETGRSYLSNNIFYLL